MKMLAIVAFFIAARTESSPISGEKRKNSSLVGDLNEVKLYSVNGWCQIGKADWEIECSDINFVGKTVDVQMKIDQCSNPKKMFVIVDVRELGIHWDQEVGDKEEHEISGFQYNFAGITGAGVYIVTSIFTDSDNFLKLKVMLKVEWLSGRYPVPLPEKTVFENRLSKVSCDEDFFWYKLNIGEKAGIVLSLLIFIILLAIILVFILRALFPSLSARFEKPKWKRSQKHGSIFMNSTTNLNTITSNSKENLNVTTNKKYMVEQINKIYFDDKK